MIRISLVIIAYLLVAQCESQEDLTAYYISVANAYAAIAALSILFAITHHSKLLLCYFLVNILLAYCSVFIISDDGYDMLSGFMWDWIVNFSLIVQMLEIAIIINGGGSVWNYYINARHNNSSSLSWFYRVG